MAMSSSRDGAKTLGAVPATLVGMRWLPALCNPARHSGGGFLPVNQRILDGRFYLATAMTSH
jgi:hypothetical protein